MQHLLTWDISLFKLINHRWKCFFLDMTMPRLTHLGGTAFSVLGCLVMILFFQGGHLGRDAALAMSGSQVVVQLAKKFCPRLRPYVAVPGTNLWEALVLKDYSFPSGHTTSSFALAVTLTLNHPLVGLAALPAAISVGLSRVYLGLHYPTDILTGALLGTVTSLIVCL